MSVPEAGETISQPLRFDQQGKVGELLPIVLVNALLNIVTLTFYRFWGKTRIRRYLWDSTKLLGDRMEYTGTGGELFKGFLFILFAVLLPVSISNFLIGLYFPPDHSVTLAYNAVLVVAVYLLLGVAIYRARRYRLSRTRWRGVRAGQTGSAVAYGAKFLGFILLNLITLGWFYPYMRMRLMSQMMNHTWFGDRQFSFAGSSGPLYRRFALCWLAALAIIIVSFLVGTIYAAELSIADPNSMDANILVSVVAIYGSYIVFAPIIFCLYKAKEIQHFAACTRFEELTFELKATTGSLLWLIVGNALILILTLGFGMGFAQMRIFKYICDRLEAAGQIDFDTIIQSAERGPGTGEGLADALDVGAV